MPILPIFSNLKEQMPDLQKLNHENTKGERECMNEKDEVISPLDDDDDAGGDTCVRLSGGSIKWKIGSGLR
ncbi:hypothetical protein GCM10008986_20530 [Salinibacillus aidingensis]|uniref:Uncharacterized protein n=1 Tax=Salinibacillus aidingensis TaxID=237684 RepID=A0ABN1BAY7_9BACI